MTITPPSGGTTTIKGTTTSSGSVTFTYALSPNAPKGTYTVSATATASGYAPGSASATFQVT